MILPIGHTDVGSPKPCFYDYRQGVKRMREGSIPSTPTMHSGAFTDWFNEQCLNVISPDKDGARWKSALVISYEDK